MHKPCLWVLPVIVVTRSSYSLFMVSTIAIKGRRDALLTLHEPCGEGFKWRAFGFPLRGDVTLALPIEGLVKEEMCPKERLVLGDRTLSPGPIVSQSLIKRSQTRGTYYIS